MIGPDPILRSLADNARKLFDHDVPLLITGETGVGKDTFARALHDASTRSEAPFIAVNCGALPENLIEGELFGYKAGAFTGAQAKGFKGQILAANGGTLLLDEIGDMPLSAQTRLLQVLEQRKVTPLGSATGVELDIRLLAATHQPLEELCRQGRFREDLYYRICGFSLPLPSLRDRSDLAYIVARLLPGYRLDNEGHFTIEARAMLETYPWPGNIRQLKHVLKTASILADGGPITPEHLQLVSAQRSAFPRISETTSTGDFVDGGHHDGAWSNPSMQSLKDGLNIADRERDIIHQTLLRTRWNVSRCAKELGVSRNTLYRKMKSYGIERLN